MGFFWQLSPDIQSCHYVHRINLTSSDQYNQALVLVFLEFVNDGKSTGRMASCNNDFLVALHPFIVACGLALCFLCNIHYYSDQSKRDEDM